MSIENQWKIKNKKYVRKWVKRVMLMLVIIVAVGIPELAMTNLGIPTDVELF